MYKRQPVLLVIGGSLGSVAINNAIRNNIDALLEKYQIIHLCGRNNLDESLEGREGYKQFEYVKAELKHYFACANVVVSRAEMCIRDRLRSKSKRCFGKRTSYEQ